MLQNALTWLAEDDIDQGNGLSPFNGGKIYCQSWEISFSLASTFIHELAQVRSDFAHVISDLGVQIAFGR